MFKIGEFSRMGQVSVRMLRHYDKLGLLKPSEVDHFTGYRYYTLPQLQTLNRILALKDLGLSLEQVGEVLETGVDAEELRGMLKLKQAEIAQTIAEEQQRLLRVQSRLRQIEQEGQPSPYEVVVKEPDDYWAVAARVVVPHLNDIVKYRCTLQDTVYDWLRFAGIPAIAPEMMIYHGEEFHDESIDMEVAVPIPTDAAEELRDKARGEISIRQLEADIPVASTLLNGDVWQIPQVIAALYAWVKNNGYEIGGSLREIHLSGRETAHVQGEPVLYEMQIPVVAG